MSWGQASTDMKPHSPSRTRQHLHATHRDIPDTASPPPDLLFPPKPPERGQSISLHAEKALHSPTPSPCLATPVLAARAGMPGQMGTASPWIPASMTRTDPLVFTRMARQPCLPARAGCCHRTLLPRGKSVRGGRKPPLLGLKGILERSEGKPRSPCSGRSGEGLWGCT